MCACANQQYQLLPEIAVYVMYSDSGVMMHVWLYSFSRLYIWLYSLSIYAHGYETLPTSRSMAKIKLHLKGKLAFTIRPSFSVFMGNPWGKFDFAFIRPRIFLFRYI